MPVAPPAPASPQKENVPENVPEDMHPPEPMFLPLRPSRPASVPRPMPFYFPYARLPFRRPVSIPSPMSYLPYRPTYYAPQGSSSVPMYLPQQQPARPSWPGYFSLQLPSRQTPAPTTQPVYVVPSPASATMGATYGIPQLTYAIQQPTYAIQQPTYAIQQPTLSVPQQTYAIQQTASVTPQPGYGAQQPIYGLQQTYGAQQPTYGIQQTYGVQQPTYGYYVP